MDRFDEACHVITALLRGAGTAPSRRYYRLRDATSPISPRLPILVAGAGPRRTARIAAKYADIWHAWASPPEFLRKMRNSRPALYRRWAADPARPGPSHGSGRAGDRVARARTGGTRRDGTPEQIADALDTYGAQRVSEFIVRDHCATPAAETLDMMSNTDHRRSGH